MEKFKITVLDFYIGVSILVVANLLPVVGEGAAAIMSDAAESYPVQATVLSLAWRAFFILSAIRIGGIIKSFLKKTK